MAVAFFAFAGISEAWLGIDPANLVYFTYQSNLFVGIVMAWAGLATLLKGVQPPAWLRGNVLLCIVITGLVANIILAPPDLKTCFYVFGIPEPYIVHRIVPIAYTIDFLFFEPHKTFKWKYAFTWFIYFYTYFAFILVRAAIWPNSGHGDGAGDPYPYPFIDLPRIGVQQFIINVVIYTLAFLVVSLILVAIDRMLPKKALLAPNDRTPARA